MTRFEQYQQALQMLRAAAAAIDQAHAQMKDAQVDDVEVNISGRWHSVGVLSDALSRLVTEVETAECAECFHPLSRHGDREYGCEYERGDVPTRCADGGDVMAAAGPCGCSWGKEVA